MESAIAITEPIVQLVKLIVGRPDEVTIGSSYTSAGLVLRLHVSPDDIGKVIGRQGRTAQSFRQILQAIAMTTNSRIRLEIDESEGSDGF